MLAVFSFLSGEGEGLSEVDAGQELDSASSLGSVPPAVDGAQAQQVRELQGVNTAAAIDGGPIEEPVSWAIRGRVTQGGEPVPGAQVDLLEQWRPSFGAIEPTDADGNFEFDLSTREFEWSLDSFKQLRVTASDRGTFSFKIEVDEDQGAYNLELPAWVGYSYSVRVVDVMTGKPRTGVPVRLRVDGSHSADSNALTDTDGIARFSSQAEEIVVFAWSGWFYGDGNLAPGSTERTVEFVGVPEVVRLRAVDATSRATIDSASWETLNESLMWSHLTPREPDVWSMQGSDWVWRACDNPTAPTCQVIVRAPGYSSRQVLCNTTHESDPLEIPLQSELRESLPNHVRIVANGEPVAGAQVEFQIHLAYLSPHLVVASEHPQLLANDSTTSGAIVDVGPFLTDQDGCVFLDVQDFWGRYSQSEFELTVTREGGKSQRFIVPDSAIRGREGIEVEIAPPTGTIVYRLGPEGDAVEVSLRHFDESRPVFLGPIAPRVEDQFHALSVKPGAQLEAVVQAGVPIRWNVPQDHGWHENEKELTLTANEVVVIDLAAVKRGAISGVIVDGDGAVWPSDVTLSLFKVLADGTVAQIQETWGVVSVYSIDPGKFEFGDVPVGEYEIRIAGLDGAENAVRTKVGESNVKIELPAQSILEVEIMNLHEVMDDASYSVVYLADGSQLVWIEGDVTEISFWPGRQSTCVVAVDGCELYRVELPNDVPVGSAIRRQVTLSPGRDIVFQEVPVELIENLDFAATRVFARSEWMSCDCYPSEDGEVFFTGLPADTVQIEFHSKDGKVWLRTVEAGLEEVLW